ncbi:hypothetical protein E2562_012349 [Oryza meyeriana var. granulata]|uniref:VQ domain-containing protein n=1 Tax=Oryza meyeriana var. granulata TaxID=110450 RepID=A0A6G1DH08_9ORYZ|nr:hypothetical protein E2562_012349 [Oryza meyeriana var. granulata]
MASTTSDSLPSSPSLPTTAGLDAGADQEFSSQHQSLFLPSSSSSYLDSPFHGLLHTSSSAAGVSPSQAPPHPPPPAPSKPPKKRPRASRRPPTTVLTTDTSNFRAMVQEFTGFPAPPFAAASPPAVRPRLLGGGGPSAILPPFLLRPSPLKYTHNPAPPLPQACTTALLGNAGAAAATSTSSLVDALALFARSNVMATPPSAAAGAASGSGSGVDQYHHHGGMVGGLFNPFDDYETTAAEGDKLHGVTGGGHGSFFSPLGAGEDKYERH